MGPRKRKKQSSRWVPEDRAVLAVCIGIALVFWFLVKMSKTYVTEKPVTLSVGVPEHLALVRLPPQNIKAELQSTGWNLMADFFLQQELVVEVELDDRRRFVLDRAQLRDIIQKELYSRDISIAELNYDRIELQTELRKDTLLPIQLREQLRFSPQYHLSGPLKTEPDSVRLSGPASQVQSYSIWPTDSLVLDALESSMTVRLPLEEPPPTIQLNPPAVRVTIPVEEFTEKSFFVPLTVANSPTEDSLRIFPQRVWVTSVVGLSQYESLGPEDFEVTADLKNAPFTENKRTVPIQVTRQPAFVATVQISPKSAEFFIVQ